MRNFYGSALAAAAVLFVGFAPAQAQDDANRKVAGGGVTVAGWTGKADTNKEGHTVADAKFAKEGEGFHVMTGPAITYWNPANKVSGDYTVKATFREDKFMELNNHPHPYGIVIGGNDLGTDTQSYLYCAAYGNGNFIVRGFGPAPFNMIPGRPGANPAVNKAAGKLQPVTQEIAVSVKGGKVSCAINGTTVAEFDKSAVVGEGKLKSTDGVYGVRFGHNTEAVVTGLTVTK